MFRTRPPRGQRTLHPPTIDTLVHRLPFFVHNLRYMTSVDDTETSIFEKLHSKMAHNIKFTNNQIKNAEVELKKSNEWNEWQSDMLAKSSGLVSQNLFFRLLQKAQEILQRQSTAKAKQSRSVFVNIEIGNDNNAGVKLLKPDLATVATHVDKESLRYCDMKTTWELKRSSSKGTTKSEIQLSLLRSNQVLRDDPFRRFIYSIYAAGSTLRLFQLNRGEVVRYESVLDIQDNTLLFLRFVNWLMLAKDIAHGLVERPTLIGDTNIDFTLPECKIPSPLVQVAPDLVTTRGTTVWPVEMKGGKSRTEKKIENPNHGLALLKLAWPYEARTNEADILRELSDVEELPRIFSANDGPLTTEFDVLPEAKHSRQRLQLGPNLQQATLEFSRSSSMANMTKEELSFRLPDVDEIADEPTDELLHARRQRWCLEEYCGVPVDTVPDRDIEHVHPSPPLERVRALRSVISAIRKMFCRERPFLHRDISPSNIMVTSPDLLNGEDTPPPGRLIDLDLACVYGDPQSGAPWRTGTFLFMAIDMLSEAHPRHHPWHDIESVFWVLFLGELNRTNEGAEERKKLNTKVSGQTETERAETLASAKERLVSRRRWANLMGPDRLRYFGKTSFPVIRLMQRLRTELFEYDERNKQVHLATFEDVAKAAEAHVEIMSDYSSSRFAIPEQMVFEEEGGEKEGGEKEGEVGEVEAGIEALNLEERVGVGGSEKDLAIESLKQAVATITERIDGWFAECIKDLETLEQEQSNEAL